MVIKSTEAVSSVTPSPNTPVVSIPSVQPQGAPTQTRTSLLSQKTRAAQVDVDVDFDIICSEKTKLSADIGKCTDWSKASDHEVEIAMNKISDWMERFEKIEEKGWSVKRSTGSFVWMSNKWEPHRI